MTREIQINITPTPRELEKAIWDLDATQQADLILAIAQRYKKENGLVCLQLANMEDEMKVLLTTEEKWQARHVFELILKHIQSAEK